MTWEEYKRKNGVQTAQGTERQGQSGTAGSWTQYKQTHDVTQNRDLRTERQKYQDPDYLHYKQSLTRIDQQAAQMTDRRVLNEMRAGLTIEKPTDYMRADADYARRSNRAEQDMTLAAERYAAAKQYGDQFGTGRYAGDWNKAYNQQLRAGSRLASDYQSIYHADMDRLKHENPGVYYGATMSGEDLNQRIEAMKANLEKLDAQRDELSRQQNEQTNRNPEYDYGKGSSVSSEEDIRALADRRNTNIQRIGDMIASLDKRREDLQRQIDEYDVGLKYQAQQRGAAIEKEYLEDGRLDTPEVREMAAQGQKRYEADRTRALQGARAKLGAMVQEQLAQGRQIGGMTRSEFLKAQEDQGVDITLDLAANLRPEDAQVFFALYAGDPEKAKEWIKYISLKRDREYQQEVAEQAKSEGWLGTIPNFVGGTTARMISGVLNVADPYGPWATQYARYSQGLLQGGGEFLNEKLPEIPENVPIIGGKGAGDVYQLLSSVAESQTVAAIAAATGNYASAVSALGVMLMGSSAAVSDYNDSMQRGLTREQATQHALAAGIAEAAFEYLSIENLVNWSDFSDTLTSRIKLWLTQGGVEASEEFFTTIANRISDGVLARKNGYDTSVEQRMKELMALGVDRDEARKTAEEEWVTELLNDAIGGFVSGNLSSGVQMITDYGLSRYRGVRDSRQYQNALEQRGADITTAEEAQALQSFAQANGIQVDDSLISGVEARSQTEAKQAELAGKSTLEQQAEKISEDKQSRKNQRQERKSNRSLGTVQEQTVGKLTAMVREAGLNNAQSVYDQQVAQHGEGISSSVQAAVARAAQTEFGHLVGQDSTLMDRAYREAIDSVTAQPLREAIRQAYEDATERAAYAGSKSAQERHLQDRLTGWGRGGALNLNAEITTKDGQTEKVTIADLGNEKGKVKLSNGETVSVKSLQGLDADVADVIQQADRFDLGTARSLMWKDYQLDAAAGKVTDGVRWIMSYTLAFDQGRRGIKTLQEAQAMSSLDEDVVRRAYQQGAEATEEWRRNQLKANEKARAEAPEGVTGKKGILDTSAVSEEAMKRLSKDKKQALDTIRMLANALGVDFRIVTQTVDEKGNIKGWQGKYNLGENTIEIDINAGINNIYKDLHTGILAVTGHELTHWMQENAPTEYLAYKRAVLSAIESGKNGHTTLERLIDQVIKDNRKNGLELTRSQAEDEVVADASMKRLGDQEFWDTVSGNLGEQKQGVVAKLKEFFSKFFAKIREIIGKTSHMAEAAQLVDQAEKAVQDTLRKLYAEGIGAAMRGTSGQAIAKGEMASNLDSGGRIVGNIEVDADSNVNRLSIRTVPQTEEGWDALVADLQRVGYSKEQAKAWINDMRSTATAIMEAMEDDWNPLDYESDTRSKWFRKNSDYKQGTVDFSNDCPRRAEFTAQFDALMKKFPNFVFTAEDYETIRGIIKDAGIPVTCGGCFVEERRQHLNEIGQLFLDKYHAALQGDAENGLGNKWFSKITKADRAYNITLNDIVSSDGLRALYENHRSLYNAFVGFNNARGMQSARLVFGLSEYKNDIRKWSAKMIRNKNNYGGVRIFSYSDADPRIVLDVMQIITDAAAKELMMQGYTKKPWFAVLMKDTGCRLLRSHIPIGQGYKIVNGKKVLTFDNFEGINTKDAYYQMIDRDRDLNIGNNVIGINDTHIRAAMVDPMIDQVIPFHTGLKKEILEQKHLNWDNYKDFQTDKEWVPRKDKNGNVKVDENGKPIYGWRTVEKNGINLYTDIINAIDWTEASTVTDAERFVNKYLDLCRERGFKPRFAQFLLDENGNDVDYNDDRYFIHNADGTTTGSKFQYKYNPGYEKFLVDFRLFDKNGKIIPQTAVKPSFSAETITRVFREYTAENTKPMKPNADVQASIEKAMRDKYGNKLDAGQNAQLSSRATDEEYMEAVENDDVVTQKRLVRDAATKAGFTSPMLYHGTNAFGFTTIKTSKDVKADGFSFWAANKESAAGTYTRYGKIREIESEISYDETEEAIEERSSEVDDAISDFRYLIDRTFSEWFYGMQGNSEIRSAVDNTNPEPGSGDGVYDLLIDQVADAFYSYSDALSETYEDFADFQERSKEWEKIEDAILSVEAAYSALSEIEREGLEGGIYQLYANTDNMFVVDAKGAAWDELHPEGLPKIERGQFKNIPYKTRDVANWARDNGYQGVIFKNIKDNGAYGRTSPFDVYAFFNPQAQVKSADLVTYDEDGEVIPLSERFNKENEDIRYSLRDYDNTLSDYDLIMGIDEDSVHGADPKAQLRETKQHISRMDSLRQKLADAREQLKAAEKRIAELEKPGSGINAQKMRAASAEAKLAIEKAQGKDRQKAAVKVEHDKLIETRNELRKTETKLANQIQREQDIIARKLTPPAMQKLLTQERKAAEEKVRQQKDERFAKYKDNQKASQLRSRIRNLSDEMKRTMTKPTDGSYVPAALYGSMTKLADALDSLLAPNDGTKAAVRYRAVMDQIHALSAEYRAVQNMDDPVYSSEYDEEIQYQIDELVKTLQGANADEVGTINMTPAKIRELNTEELQKVYNILKYINWSMKTAKDMMSSGQFRSVYDALTSIEEQQRALRSAAGMGWLGRTKRSRMLDSLNVMRAVEMMSNWDRSAALYQIMHQVEQGVVKSDAWMMDYNKSLQELKTGKNEKAYRDALTKKLDYSVTDEEGLPVKMTKMQAIQILMTAEREAGNDKLVHLQKGGAVIRDALKIQDGKTDKAGGQTIQITPELLQRIQNSRTEWDRAYMKAVRSYLTKEGRAINQVMYALKHRVLETEPNYVPYIVDKDYLDTKLDEAQAMRMWVKTPGSTNALKQKASQPVIIDGMDTVMAKHVKEIADYIGMALPIRDFSKVYNGKLKQSEGKNPLPVKKLIDRNWEKKGLHLLTQSIIDVQGGSRSNSWSTAIAEHLNALQSAFVKSALLINPSVTIKQAASYVAAGSILSRKALDLANHPVLLNNDVDTSKAMTPGAGLIGHIFAAPNGKTATRIYNEIDKYTSMHYQRRQGMSQYELANEANRSGPVRRAVNNLGARMEQNVFGHAARKVGASLNPVSWIQRMDVATTATLWLACKEQARMDGLTVNSQEYWQRTTELYERVLRETQPMYDSLHRNAFQKGQGLFQYLFPFRTVPIQNHGQLAAAVETWMASKNKSTAEKKEAAKFLRKTAWAQTESAIVFSLMTFLAAALKRKTKKYRDEDEELGLGSVLKGIGTDTAGTLFSVLMPVAGSELWNIGSRLAGKFDGSSGYTYDAISVGVVDLMNDLAGSFDKIAEDLGKLHRGEDASEFWSHGLTMLLKAAKLAGIPADTVKTYWQGIRGNVEDALNGRLPALNDESWERSAAVNAERYVKALEAGDAEKVDRVEAEMLQDYADAGKSEEEAAKALKTKLTSTLKEKYEGGSIEAQDAVDLLVETGFYDENDAWKKVKEWEVKAEHKGETDYHYSQYDELYAAMDQNGDVSKIVKDLENHGVDPDSVKSEAKRHLIDRYMAGEINSTQVKNQLSRYCGIVGTDATNLVRWLDLRKAKPGLEVTQAQCNSWYDGSKKTQENGHESAKAAGMSIEAYLEAKAVLDEIKDSNDNGTGEDEVIEALAKMKLTPRQKDALYYERYKGTTKYSVKKW